MDKRAETTNRFELLTDQFLEGYFRFNPTLATDLGLHEYDSLLEDRTAEAVQGEIERLKGFQQRLRREIEPAALGLHQQIDVEILQSAIAAERLELEEIRAWQRNPAYYNWLASSSVYSLLIREHASLEDRLRAVMERQRRIPSLLSAGRENLRASLDAPGGVPKVWVDIALEEFAGGQRFFHTVVPEVARRSPDASLTERVLEENRRVLTALQEMITFLRQELLAAAKGDFALGRDVFRRKLRWEEAIETPTADILARGEKELRDVQREMRSLGHAIDPDLALDAVIKKLADDHPQPDDLIASYRRQVGAARQFVIEHDLVTVPDGELRVVETPPFLRSLLFAALDPPGPFERPGLPTYFYVTPVEPTWSAAEREAYLRQHNQSSQIDTIFHEAYPGHYVQSAHCRRTASRLRRVFMAGTFVEGWAHYAEQLMVDEGFAPFDSTLRLFQLHEALWRIGRLIVATRLHTEGLSFEAAVEFLMRECYQERANAVREVKRYTTDPLVLIYSWGKWQILDLRRAYRERRGAAFSLKEFHDRVLGQGEPPVALLKRLLLGEDKGQQQG